ncbi:hypothetical protein FSP39_013500 [Pinctada imbricata]|uniref:Uncharacterized protein n=1 Tax=Pinctada imbricata TaxID=66713 RepID=A0AA88XIR7_PINIB|nr:hypothetical protein FSP39_013500 [Pinctada imbricata]
MAVDIPGVIGVVVFYIVILVIGIIAGRKKSSDSNTQFLANRGLGLIVASFTLSATMVGGAYINGTAEAVGRDGFIWIVASVSYNIGILIAGVFIAPKVRRIGYTTIFDPLQNRYGKKMGALLFFNELFANLFWEAAILGALGTSLALILDLNLDLSVIISACVAVAYTFFGGLYSVAYTDVIQLILITVGLVLSIPFIYTNKAVDLSRVKDTWTGSLPPSMIGLYIDIIFLCIGGGMPWQAYYQRVLACKSPSVARNASLLGTLMSVLLLIPPSFVGIAGAAADWNMTAYDGNVTLSAEEWASVVPMSLHFLCPRVVSVIGLGAVSAAVMSSADSIVLATGSVFARNIYQTLFRPKATEREIVWVLRVSILVVGAAGTVIALTVRSVYALYVLCGDLMFVAHFPQVICALWLKCGNTYGSLAGFIMGLSMRILGGEPALKIHAVIKFPFYDEETETQLFPFRTVAMLCSFAGIICVSFITDYAFRKNIINRKFDVFNCYPVLKENTELNKDFLKLNSERNVQDDQNEKSKFLDDYKG